MARKRLVGMNRNGVHFTTTLVVRSYATHKFVVVRKLMPKGITELG